MKRWAGIFLLLSAVMSAQQFNTDIVPASPGLRIGHSNQRWNGFFRNMDISGTCNINGVPCGSGGGGNSIATYTVASLPPSPPVNTLAIVSDGNGPSCTIGGGTSHNLCQFNAFQWVLVSGGSGGSSDFSTLGGGTALGKAFFVGSGSTFSTIGSGSITATNVPVTKTAILHQWIDSYDAVGRTFHSSQPTYPDITGIPTIGEIKTTSSAPWLLMDPATLSGHNDGLEFSFFNGSLLMFPFGSTPTVSMTIAGKANAPVNIGNLVAFNGFTLPSIISSCLETDSVGLVHAASGGPCGSGGGSVTFPLNAPDGSTSSPQYSFTNDPELGLAVAPAGDKPQIRQVVVAGAGPGQTITLTVSSPINNLSWNAGDRFILSGLPSTPTDLTSLIITPPSRYVVTSVTSTTPTGTATFSTTSTTITPGTYPVTSGFAQIYENFLVGRGTGFNRLEDSSPNPAQSGSIRLAARSAVKSRANFGDDSTMDVSHLRGTAPVLPNNSPGSVHMSVNGAHSSSATTLSIARDNVSAWSAVAGDQILIGKDNGDSNNQKYTIVSPVTVAAGANTSVTITPGLKTALNGGEIVVARFIRTQVGEESGVEIPGDTELKGDLTLSSTKPTLIQVKKQSSAPTLNTIYDAGWFLNSSNRFQCKLSIALGGGDCAPLGIGSGYQTIQDEAVAVAAETTVNFTGAGVTCVDNAGQSRTDCTIPGGSGVSGSGTTSKVPKFTGAGSIGDSSIDDGLTTANTVTINASGGLNILGSGAAGVMAPHAGTTPVTVASSAGFAGPTSVSTPWLIQLPGAGSTGFLAASTATLNIYPGNFRSMAATSPITITNADGSSGNPTYACPTCGVTGSPLSQFSATTSANMQSVVSDEIGNGKLVFASAYQGSDVNVMSAGTVAGTGAGLCTSANGGATTSNCHLVTSTSPGAGIAHFAGSTQDLTSSPVDLAAGATEITGVLPLANMSQLFVNNAKTTTYQVLAADFAACKTITTASASFTVTLVASGSQPASGQCIDVLNYGSGTITVARSGQNINGAAANLTIPAASASTPTSLHIVSDGTNYFAESMGQGTAAGVTSFSGDGVIITNSGSTGAVTATIAGTSGGIPCFGSTSSWKSSALLATSGLVLGQGATNCPSTVAGISSDGASKLILGVAGSSVGSIDFKNGTSGTMNIAPPTGALGTTNIVGPPASGTMMMTNTNVTAAQMPALTGDATTSAGAVAVTIAANAVTAAKSAVVLTYRVCDIAFGDTSGSAITNAQLGPQKRICFIPAAATVVEVDVAADAGTPNVIVGRSRAGVTSNLVSSALATAASGGIACSKTGATTGLDGTTTCSATLQNTGTNAGDYFEAVSGTAGGTAKFMTVHIVYTIN